MNKEAFCSSWADRAFWRRCFFVWIISVFLLNTISRCVPPLKHCCTYISCMCNKRTTKSWLICRQYAWLTWNAITSFSDSHATKVCFTLILHVVLLCMCFLTWIKHSYASVWKILKTQHQWDAGQIPCFGIWTLSILIGKLGEHEQFPSFHPASFNTAQFSLSWILFIQDMAILAVSMSCSALPRSL